MEKVKDHSWSLMRYNSKYAFDIRMVNLEGKDNYLHE